jgi:hypothetical protein
MVDGMEFLEFQDELGRELPAEPPKKPVAPRRPAFSWPQQQEAGMFGGSIVDYGRMAAGAGAAAQGSHLGNMMNMTMGAINQENQSRVAQSREARRMQHERDMLLMRLRGMNQAGGSPGDEPGDLTGEQMAALAVLQQENALGRRGTTRSAALRKLGLL